MKITLYYNQYSNAGAVYSERWELDPAESNTFYCAETLRTHETTIPDDWTIGELPGHVTAIFNEHDNMVFVDGDYKSIILTSTDIRGITYIKELV